MKAKALFTALVAGALMIGATASVSSTWAQQRGPASAPSRAEAPKVAKVGEMAPMFKLKDLEGKEHNLADHKGKIIVLEWFNPGCPFVVKHHEHHPTFRDLYNDYSKKDVVFFAINSGAPGKQGHGIALNKEKKEAWGIKYPILVDEPGTVGRMYGAVTTPHMYIIDKDGKLVYNGAIDNDRSARNLGDKNYVRQALEEILAGTVVSEPETRPYGCSVKYAGTN